MPAFSRPSRAFVTRSLAAVLVPLVAVTALSASAPATTGFAPVAGPQFNDPTGGADDQYALTNAMIDNADHAPKGSVIRMAFYSLSTPSVVDALVKAHDRGVNVRILMDAHGTPSSLWTRLADALGTDPNATSYAVLCTNGCIQGYATGALHAKFYMFSTSGDGHWVTSVSSSNPTNAQATQAWNNSYTTVGDTTVYNTHYKFFNAMLASATAGNRLEYWANEVLATPYRTYTFPKQSTGTATDTMWQILNKVSCSGAASGYGTAGGHTRIRVDMFEWTLNRLAVAQKLAELRKAGCSVGVVYASSAVDDTITSTLTDAGISVADSVKDGNGDGVADHYTHGKTLIVDGRYNGNAKSRRVFTGSPNLTANSLKHNDESMEEIASTSVYNAYYTHWHDLWTWSKTSSGGTTPQVKSAGKPVKMTDAQLDDS